MSLLLAGLETTRNSWSSATRPTSYLEAIRHLGQFAEYKKTSKRASVRERQELAALYSNIQTKIRTYALKVWEPKEGLRLEVGYDQVGEADEQDLEQQWAAFLIAEGVRSRAINAKIREYVTFSAGS